MFKKQSVFITALVCIMITALIAGCGGGSGAKRLTGLQPDEVVKTFVTEVKNNKLDNASAYVSPSSRTDKKAIAEMITGKGDLGDLKTANILASKVAAQSGSYAAVVVTLQQENSFKVTVKPVGLEKIDNEWYLVSFEKIYYDAKYSVLAQLLGSI